MRRTERLRTSQRGFRGAADGPDARHSQPAVGQYREQVLQHRRRVLDTLSAEHLADGAAESRVRQRLRQPGDQLLAQLHALHAALLRHRHPQRVEHPRHHAARLLEHLRSGVNSM